MPNNTNFILEPIVPQRPLSKANIGGVHTAMRDFAANLTRRMGKYPPQQATDYRRTGRLGRSWTFSGPYSSGGDLVVDVGNNVAYTPFVQGLLSGSARLQTRVMAGKGWESVEPAAKQEWARQVPAIERALQQTWERVEQASAEVRCTGPFYGRPCRRLLAYVSGKHFRLEIKCPRCNYLNIYDRATMPPAVPQRAPRPLRL